MECRVFEVTFSLVRGSEGVERNLQHTEFTSVHDYLLGIVVDLKLGSIARLVGAPRSTTESCGCMDFHAATLFRVRVGYINLPIAARLSGQGHGIPRPCAAGSLAALLLPKVRVFLRIENQPPPNGGPPRESRTALGQAWAVVLAHEKDIVVP